MKESITRKRQAPSIATVGSTCDLNLKIPGELCHQCLLHLSAPISPASSSSTPSFYPSSLHSSLAVLAPPGCRKLVSDGFSSGTPDTDVHPQQPHLHPDRADGDQQNSSRRDQAGGPGGGEHAGWRSFQRCVRRFSWTGESERVQRDAGRQPTATAGRCVCVKCVWTF